MTPAKITTPLLLGLLGTIGFNLAPIALGYGMPMNACFVGYAALMLYLHSADRRVLGYATVLSACNPANNGAYLSYSLLLALLTLLRESSAAGRIIQKLGRRSWWWLLLAAFLLIGLSVPFWAADLRTTITEIKCALSRLGYLAVLPLAVGLTLRTLRDGVRAVSWLCFVSAALLALFYFLGENVMAVNTVGLSDDLVAAKRIGSINVGMVRTSACIVLAALAAGAFALGLGGGLQCRAWLFYLASGTCCYMITQLASTGSTLAMACGFGVLGLGYVRARLPRRRLLLGGILFAIVATVMYWAAFQGETTLSKRIELKTAQTQSAGIDRQVFWDEGFAAMRENPFGQGWAFWSGHSDWQCFLTAYGFPTGLLYIVAAGSLGWSLWRDLRQHRASADPQLTTLCLIGLAVLTVYAVNAILDMLSAGIGNYQTVWAMILTPAAVLAVTDARKRTPQSNGRRTEARRTAEAVESSGNPGLLTGPVFHPRLNPWESKP